MSNLDPTKVYVVMGNDFPESVYTNKAEAEAWCAKAMADQRVGLKAWEHPRIYWRVYEFDLLGARNEQS